MQKLFTLLMCCTLILSCNDNKKGEKRKILPESSGKINNLSVVIENDLWEGQIGEAIRETLASPVDGLPQDEPLFTMSQIPPSVFSGFVAQNRTVLKIETAKNSEVKIASNVFARPQRVVLVSGSSNEEIAKLIKANSKRIIKALKDTEIKEKQRRMALSLHKTKAIEENLGISIKFPSAYRIGVEEDGFFWLRKDITTGTTNIMIYELPYGTIKRNDSLAGDIIKLRDSIGKAHIPGPVDGSYMITEQAYAPFIFETTIDGKPALETKGLWDVKNAFMSGPFINYVIDDKANNRQLVLEGFAFAPSVEKREYMFELEAILKSVKFK
ncbi:DUF4837 family protein [Mangrovimonas spongiae]|uniref:DUF4837 family protein n=1 Tax=Mangrovimonas spongiae TaxID=2494697 RepID=A0A3R9MGG0_9FLAO|nr:DUF4837 family protein [Mangrovimonas spongiae]RSK41532.1 DUF4837 family protein [Mangrovimonas spongiae]